MSNYKTLLYDFKNKCINISFFILNDSMKKEISNLRLGEASEFLLSFKNAIYTINELKAEIQKLILKWDD